MFVPCRPGAHRRFSEDSIVLAGYLGLSAVLVSLFVLMAKLTGMDAALSFSRGFASLYLGRSRGV